MFTEAHNLAESSDAGSAAGPIRMCLGCRERAPQESLVRVWLQSKAPSKATTAAGNMSENVESWVLDRHEAGAARSLLQPSGRGMYVHLHRDCVSAACVGKRLSRAFRKSISEKQIVALREKLEQLCASRVTSSSKKDTGNSMKDKGE